MLIRFHLRTGDRVRLITSKKKMVNPNWLYMTNSPATKEKIFKALNIPKKGALKYAIGPKGIIVAGRDRVGLFHDVTGVFKELGINIETTYQNRVGEKFYIFFSVQAKNQKKLDEAIKRISKIKNILSVEEAHHST